MYSGGGSRAGHFGADPNFGIASSSASRTTNRYDSLKYFLHKFLTNNISFKNCYQFHNMSNIRFFSLELRRRIRQDSDSDRQVSHLNRSEVVEGSASFINNSNQSSYTKSSYNPNFEDRNIFNHGKFSHNQLANE